MISLKPLSGFSLSSAKGFFAASSEIQSQNSFRVEGAAKNGRNIHKVCKGIVGSNSPKVSPGILPSGVTRSRSVSN